MAVKLNYLIFIMSILLFNGCAVMVETSDNLGGVQTGNRWGLIKYAQATRKDAIKKMTKYCSPFSYKIASVNHRSQMVYVNGYMVPRDETVTKFECVESYMQ